MTASRLDLIFPSGDTWTKTIAWKDGNGALIDTSGWSFVMQIVDGIDAASPVLTLSTANGLITVGIVGDYNIRWSVDHATTVAIPVFTRGCWAMEATDVRGYAYRLVEGRCFWSPTIVR